MTLEKMPRELGFELLHRSFEIGNVSMEMLLSMSVDDLKECMKQISKKRFCDRRICFERKKSLRKFNDISNCSNSRRASKLSNYC